MGSQKSFKIFTISKNYFSWGLYEDIFVKRKIFKIIFVLGVRECKELVVRRFFRKGQTTVGWDGSHPPPPGPYNVNVYYFLCLAIKFLFPYISPVIFPFGLPFLLVPYFRRHSRFSFVKILFQISPLY